MAIKIPEASTGNQGTLAYWENNYGSPGGDFSGGTLRAVRVNNLVTVTLTAPVANALTGSSDIPSSAGILSTVYRPDSQVRIYSQGINTSYGVAAAFLIDTTGTIYIIIHNSNNIATLEPSTPLGQVNTTISSYTFTASYIVA